MGAVCIVVRRMALSLGLIVSISLAGCASTSHAVDEAVMHSVDTYESASAFLQTHTYRSHSLRWQVDADGYRWPAGLTLNAWASTSMVDDTVVRRVEFRHDVLYPGSDLDAAYQLARDLRHDLGQNCRDIVVWLGDPDDTSPMQAVRLPVEQVVVRVFTDRARMPVPPTDQEPDVLASMVEENPPYRLVVSTRFDISPDEALFARLAAAPTIRYDLCGPVASATPDEILGLRQVYGWLKP